MSLYIDVEKKLKNFNLKIKFDVDDESLALFGKSGSGKSMTLKMIAGIEKPDRGKIILNGRTLYDSFRNIFVKTEDRNVGLMLQNFGLFPNMTVEKNIYLGSKRRKLQNPELEVNKLIEKFHLSHIRTSYPREISGGEKQRTALARTMISNPEIIMLDEPFSSLDNYLKFRMENSVREAISEYDKTFIIVTHDSEVCYRLSDKICLMKNGEIDSYEDTRKLFKNPQTYEAAIFTGKYNLSRIEKKDDKVRLVDFGIDIYVRATDKNRFMAVKYDDIIIGESKESYKTFITDIIDEMEYKILVTKFNLDGDKFYIKTDEDNYRIGQKIHISFVKEKIKFFER